MQATFFIFFYALRVKCFWSRVTLQPCVLSMVQLRNAGSALGVELLGDSTLLSPAPS